MSVDWDSYAARWAGLHGGYDPRVASPLVRGWLRIAYRTARGLNTLRVTPSAVTALGVAFAAGVPVAAAAGGFWPLAGAALVLLGALADTTDGALALVSGRETRLGRVYDSVADRVTEAAWLAGMWLLGTPGWLVALAGAVVWLHEYLRARATIAGMSDIGAVTLGERPTRVLLILFGYAFAAPAGLAGADLAAGTATVATAILALLGGLGLGQLAAAVRHALRD